MKSSLILSIIFIIFNFSTSAMAGDVEYKQAFTYIKQKNWSNAENLAKKIHDRALLKIVLSQKFLDETYKNTDFSKVAHFLKQNPKWPENRALKIRAENLINPATDKIELYDWFKNNPPITGNGHKYYVLSAASIEKNEQILIPIIKNSWIYGCFSKDEQSNFLRQFKKYLTLEDNVNRIDNLLFNGSISSAKNSLNLVNSGYKKSFEVQMAFLDGNSNAKKLFKSIPKEYYTQGLVYQYINSKKTDLPNAKEIVALINLIKHNKAHEGDFWGVQSYLAREYIQNKQFSDAYLIASSHFAKTPANISDAEFLSGWPALRFLNKPKVAIEHFNKFNAVVKTPISTARGLYWLGRAYAASNMDVEAKKLYQQSAHKFGYSFYGQVATMELGETKLRLPSKPILTNYKNESYTKNHDILNASKLVSKYGSNGLAQIYLTSLIEGTDNSSQILAIALEMESIKLHHRVWMSKKSIEKHVFIHDYSFPTPYKLKSLPIEEALTYSIIRQETVFDQYARSSADALGLMQLVKPTACEISKKLNMKCDVLGLTKNPIYNITIGSNYLAERIQKYNNSYILTAIGYNAGPGRANKWVNQYGDPRKLKNIHKIIDWIEVIPFKETRDYVQRVLENLQIYRIIINKNNSFKLKEDLMRG